MGFIDTHSHIYEPEFKDDVEEVIERAKAVGVSRILLPNCNAESIEPMLSLCHRHPDYLYPMMGLHPEDIKENYREVLDRMHDLLTEPQSPYVAVGEVGLDYYWDRSLYDLQQEVFDEQIGWAAELRLPLMIHARSAHQELVALMEQHRSDHLTGVFHCFGGTREEAEDLLSFDGFVLGIGGVVTYKKSKLPAVLREAVPLSRIVIETDAPYLAPTPHRGKRNEPAFAADTVRFLAQVYEVTPEKVMEMTNDNAKHLFLCLKS